MSKDKITPNRALPIESNEFFAGNANRVRNKTIALSAGLTRQIREMANIPLQIETGDAPSIDHDGAERASYDGQAALDFHAPHLQSDAPEEAQELAPLIGFLVSYDNVASGEVFPIRHGRSVITGHPLKSGAKQIVIPDQSISFAHAIVRTGPANGIEFIDQLSEGGSVLIRNGNQIPFEGSVQHLQHGDLLKLGNRSFHLCLIGQR